MREISWEFKSPSQHFSLPRTDSSFDQKPLTSIRIYLDLIVSLRHFIRRRYRQTPIVRPRVCSRPRSRYHVLRHYPVTGIVKPKVTQDRDSLVYCVWCVVYGWLKKKEEEILDRITGLTGKKGWKMQDGVGLLCMVYGVWFFICWIVDETFGEVSRGGRKKANRISPGRSIARGLCRTSFCIRRHLCQSRCRFGERG